MATPTKAGATPDEARPMVAATLAAALIANGEAVARTMDPVSNAVATYTAVLNLLTAAK